MNLLAAGVNSALRCQCAVDPPTTADYVVYGIVALVVIGLIIWVNLTR